MTRHRPVRPRRQVYALDHFICVHCGNTVPGQAAGTTHRNHCPHCLWSTHLDLVPGDRRSACRGAMEPIAIWVRGGGEWTLIHRCRRCAKLVANRVAGDDDASTLREI